MDSRYNEVKRKGSVAEVRRDVEAPGTKQAGEGEGERTDLEAAGNIWPSDKGEEESNVCKSIAPLHAPALSSESESKTFPARPLLSLTTERLSARLRANLSQDEMMDGDFRLRKGAKSLGWMML